MSDNCPHCVRIEGVPNERVWLHPAGLPHHFSHDFVEVYAKDKIFFEHGSPMTYGGVQDSDYLDVFRPHLRLGIIRLKRLMQLKLMSKCRTVRTNIGRGRWLYG